MGSRCCIEAGAALSVAELETCLLAEDGSELPLLEFISSPCATQRHWEKGPTTPRSLESASKKCEQVRKVVDPTVLEIIFQLPDGIEQQLAFTRRPLGLDFDRESPIVIKKVQPRSIAEELGVQPGWLIKYVNGEACWMKDFRYQFALLHKYSANIIEHVEQPAESFYLKSVPCDVTVSTNSGGSTSERCHMGSSIESSTFQSGPRFLPTEPATKGFSKHDSVSRSGPQGQYQAQGRNPRRAPPGTEHPC